MTVQSGPDLLCNSCYLHIRNEGSMTCVTKTSGETRQKRYDTLTLLFFSVTLPRHALLRPVHDCLFFITVVKMTSSISFSGIRKKTLRGAVGIIIIRIVS